MGAGRPKGSFKYGKLDVYQYRKLKAKINILKDIRRSMISDIKRDGEEIVRLNNFMKKIEKEVGITL